MKIYIVSYINTDYKYTENEINTKYFIDKDETIKYLIDLHDNSYCFEEIGKKKRCKSCNWKKGLNNMPCFYQDYFDINVVVNIIETEKIESNCGVEINISSGLKKELKNEIKNNYINIGSKWSINEYDKLLKEIKNNEPIEIICKNHGRNIGGITKAIERLLDNDKIKYTEELKKNYSITYVEKNKVLLDKEKGKKKELNEKNEIINLLI